MSRRSWIRRTEVVLPHRANGRSTPISNTEGGHSRGVQADLDFTPSSTADHYVD